MGIGTIARRSFLVGSAAVGGGVAFGVYQFRKPLPNPLEDDLKEGEATLNPFIKIDQSGVTLITPRADKGQGAYSMQTYLLAEELDVDPLTVKTSVGKPSPAYYNSTVMEEGAPGLGAMIGRLMGMQMTGGSSTVTDMFVRMREAAAVARETIKKAASLDSGVPVSDLKTEDGHVVFPDGSRASYAELAPKVANLKPVRNVTLRDPSEWRFLGKEMLRTDIVDKTKGAFAYGIDVELEGMLHATVRANPGIGGPVNGYDASKAEAMRGVKKIVPIKGGVGVIADNTWRAFKAADAIDIDWGAPDYPENSAGIWAELDAHLDPKFKNVQRRNDGAVDDAIDANAVIEAEYRAPFLAHAPLEPMNATVLYTPDRIDIWTGTQIPRFIENHVADVTGLGKDKIHLHVLPMGGSFGRRLEDTYVIQAVEVAMAVPGVPVKMTWSREEDFSHDYPRPAGICRARGAVADGQVKAFDMDLVGASLIASWMGRLATPLPGPDPTLTTGADDQPYAIENYRVTGYKAPENVPISSWRSVAASQNGFFHECFLDELIHAAGADPLAERIRLADNPVAKAALEAVGAMANWDGPGGDGVGRGVALVRSFFTTVAEIVEVRNTDAGIKIENVWIAADVGAIIDPVNLEAQLFGGAIFGLGHAMNCELTYENYRPTQTNYHAYEGMRLYQTPTIKVKALENGEAISGAGEPGLPPAAPALANAIFAATGERLREMPFNKHVKFV